MLLIFNRLSLVSAGTELIDKMKRRGFGARQGIF